MSDPWAPYEGPVEQHPATARLRAHIAALESLPESMSNRAAALEHARRQLRQFNAAEYDSRARMFLAAEAHAEREP